MGPYFMNNCNHEQTKKEINVYLKELHNKLSLKLNESPISTTLLTKIHNCKICQEYFLISIFPLEINIESFIKTNIIQSNIFGLIHNKLFKNKISFNNDDMLDIYQDTCKDFFKTYIINKNQFVLLVHCLYTIAEVKCKREIRNRLNFPVISINDDNNEEKSLLNKLEDTK